MSPCLISPQTKHFLAILWDETGKPVLAVLMMFFFLLAPSVLIGTWFSRQCPNPDLKAGFVFIGLGIWIIFLFLCFACLGILAFLMETWEEAGKLASRETEADPTTDKAGTTEGSRDKK